MSVSQLIRSVALLAVAFGGAALLAGCEQVETQGNYRAYAPIPSSTLALMAEKGTVKDAPMLIRAYKKEAEFEVWKRKPDGSYVFLKQFPMCRWSGQLGPKVNEGDRQVPEGFYTITPGSMNPNSHYYLSFNVGYPNAYDRANGHGGGSIMVHGICSSAGCFSMTDKQIEEIYALARESFAGGQRSIQMQSYPFRMTAENMAKLRLDPNMPFWKELKKGSDYFEVTKAETPVGVCNRHYVFGASPKSDALSDCPAVAEDAGLKAELAAKEKKDDAEIAELVGKGVKPVRIVYADGGQHPSFANQIPDVSRPDSLAAGPTEIALDDGVKSKVVAVQVAAAKARSKALLAQDLRENVAVPGKRPLAVAAIVPAPVLPAAAAQTIKVAQAVPASAVPPAAAKVEAKDEGANPFKKLLSFGAATKSETAPAVAATEPAAPTPTTVKSRQAALRLGAGKASPAHDAAPAPAKPEQLSSVLPKEITGDKPGFPRQLLALMPTWN